VVRRFAFCCFLERTSGSSLTGDGPYVIIGVSGSGRSDRVLRRPKEPVLEMVAQQSLFAMVCVLMCNRRCYG